MTKQHSALLDLIREFKPSTITDLEATLNVISNHAAQIRELTDRVHHLELVLDQIADKAIKRSSDDPS